MSAYDAIVAGARCGGSPTAMLLARKGYRVLLVDRASFPSDTLSCHFIQPGVACLERWGLLPEVARSNCPPVRSQTLDIGPFALKGAAAPAGDTGLITLDGTVVAPRANKPWRAKPNAAGERRR